MQCARMIVWFRHKLVNFKGPWLHGFSIGNVLQNFKPPYLSHNNSNWGTFSFIVSRAYWASWWYKIFLQWHSYQKLLKKNGLPDERKPTIASVWSYNTTSTFGINWYDLVEIHKITFYIIWRISNICYESFVAWLIIWAIFGKLMHCYVFY